MQFTGCGLLVI